jgi:hypothetical protein
MPQDRRSEQELRATGRFDKLAPAMMQADAQRRLAGPS